MGWDGDHTDLSVTSSLTIDSAKTIRANWRMTPLVQSKAI